MAYQTGTATTPTDLLQKLVTWLAAIGWTTDKSAGDGVKGGWRAHLHLGGTYVHLRSAINEAIWDSMNANLAPAGNDGCGIGLYLSTSYNGAVAWNVQPGTPPYQTGSATKVAGCGMTLPPGAIANYYFFADAGGDNVVVVVERSSGIFSHIGWGSSLVKSGSYSNGAYFFGSTAAYNMTRGMTYLEPGLSKTAACPASNGDSSGNAVNCYVRVDVDTFVSKWIGFASATSAASGATGKTGTSSVQNEGAGGAADSTNPALYNTGTVAQSADPFYSIQARMTSSLDGRANLLPLLLWIPRDAGGVSLLGSIPRVFFCNGANGNGYGNAEEYLLGADTYKLFPYFAVKKQV